MKITVIYHRSDFDGEFCHQIARKFLDTQNNQVEFIGWEYGDPVPTVHEDTLLYILDLSVEPLMTHPKLIWIDHHASAIQKYPSSIMGYRIDGVAACRLAWQYFSNAESQQPLPTKQDYIDRKVTEPWAVRLAGEYDIWDKRDDNSELFQHGLRSEDLTSETWGHLLNTDRKSEMTVVWLLKKGAAIQYAKTQENKGIIESYGFELEWEGLVFLACNHARFNSHLFTARLTPAHDACLGFNWDGKNHHWRISLYHAPGKEHHDLSVIAKKYGGGGHRGACGMTVKTLPFPLL